MGGIQHSLPRSPYQRHPSEYPECAHERIGLKGMSENGKQRRVCLYCRKQFTDERKRRTPKEIAAIVAEFRRKGGTVKRQLLRETGISWKQIQVAWKATEETSNG